MVLVGLEVNDKGQGVVFLDLLHGGLGVQWVANDTVLVHARQVRDRLACILWLACQLQGLWQVEVGRGADFTDALAVDTLQGGLLGSGSLLSS